MSDESQQRHTIPGAVRSSNTRGNQWHDARNGEFTSGPSTGAASSQLAANPQKETPREKSDVMNFVVAHHKDAEIIAASLNVPTEFILGLSGAETTWGKSRFAINANNFFSLEAKKGLPFQIGSLPFSRHGNMAKFESYLDSGRAFARKYGDAVRGINNPIAFANALVRARFNSGDSRTGGNSNFVPFTESTIKSAGRRLRTLK